VADQQAVPEEAVAQIGQQVQVGAGGDAALVDPALQHGPERGAALGGEPGQGLGHVLVVLGLGGHVTDPAGLSRIGQGAEAVGPERGQVGLERPRVARRHHRRRLQAHGLGQHRALGRPPPVDRLPAHPGGLGDRVDGQAVQAAVPQQLHGRGQDRLAGRLVPPPPRVWPVRGLRLLRHVGSITV
jgi:hypothetical protein